jgi:hypothetical protein
MDRSQPAKNPSSAEIPSAKQSGHAKASRRSTSDRFNQIRLRSCAFLVRVVVCLHVHAAGTAENFLQPTIIEHRTVLSTDERWEKNVQFHQAQACHAIPS